MNIQELFEQLLQSGREIAERGQQIAENKLEIPKQGKERDAMLDGMGKGALAAGGLAALLGTRTGRRLTGGALKLGGLAAVGTLAYQTYAKWQQDNSLLEDQAHDTANKLTGENAHERSRILIKAMVAAAKADGQIDDTERSKITQQIHQLQLDEDAAQLIINEIEQPLDPQRLADEADSTASAAEIYLVSRSVIDVDNEMERSYLQQLAKALALPAELVEELDKKLFE